MYKTVKTQTNLPVKICHLKVLFSWLLLALQVKVGKVASFMGKILQKQNILPTKITHYTVHTITHLFTLTVSDFQGGYFQSSISIQHTNLPLLSSKLAKEVVIFI